MRKLLAGLVAVVALAGSAPAATAEAAHLKWTTEPTGLSDAVPYRVEGDASSMWTVGIKIVEDGEGLPFQPLALHRTGGTWQQTEQLVDRGRLDDVAVRTPTDVWAIGSAWEGRVDQPLIQRWNGRQWSREAGPLAPETAGQFSSIDVGRDNDLWVTGSTETADGSENIVYRYADGDWHQVTTKGLEHLSYTWKLVPQSGDDVWAVGIGGIAHFDGSSWTRAELPGDTGPRRLNIQDLVVRAPDDIWAVGHRPDDGLWRKPLVLHYNGSTWSEVPSPADTAQLHSIQFVNGKAIALGENPSTNETYVLERKGYSFVRAADPPGAGSLYDSILSGGRIWAVGVVAPEVAGEPDPYIGSAQIKGTGWRSR